MIDQGSLWGIIIECSYTNSVPNSLLFGHLKPSLLLNELDVLVSKLSAGNLYLPPVIISHIKPSAVLGINPATIISQEVAMNNTHNFNFVFPQQGALLTITSSGIKVNPAPTTSASPRVLPLWYARDKMMD